MLLTAPDQLLAELGSVIPPERVLTDPDALAPVLPRRRRVGAGRAGPGGVRARSDPEVQEAVRVCADLRVARRPAGRRHRPVRRRQRRRRLPRPRPLEDGPGPRDRRRTTSSASSSPASSTTTSRRPCAEQGLWYPPDPASAPWSTIGGNVATNAGGLCCLKYGVTRDYVLGMRVVIGPPANAVRLGRRTAKGVAGLDLAGLMVGSEGTLGVVTEVTLRLRPARRRAAHHRRRLRLPRRRRHAVAAVTRPALTPSALELIDRDCLAAVEEWKHLGLPVDAERGAAGRPTRRARPASRGGRDPGRFEAAGALGPRSHRWRRPSSVRGPPARLPGTGAARAGSHRGRLRAESEVPPCWRASRDRGAADIPIATIAHAGDGNLHPLLITPLDDTEARARAELAFHEIIVHALELGGTVTGEHGVGLLKMDGLVRELSPAVMEMHHVIKDALDPHGIFNPGKVFATRDETVRVLGTPGALEAIIEGREDASAGRLVGSDEIRQRYSGQ